jgi:PKD repeat protein
MFLFSIRCEFLARGLFFFIVSLLVSLESCGGQDFFTPFDPEESAASYDQSKPYEDHYIKAKAAEDNPFGLNSHGFPLGALPTVSATRQAKALLEDLGIGWIRGGLNWRSIECPNYPQEPCDPSSPDRFHWSGQDKIVRYMQSKGLNIYFELCYAPKAYTNVEKGWYLPAEHIDKWERFLEAAVERYDGDGEKDMPGLLRGVKYWGLWNEPNNDGSFWKGSRSEFINHIVLPGIKAIKKTNSQVKICGFDFTGLGFGSGDKRDSKKWFSAIRTALRQDPGVSENDIAVVTQNFYKTPHTKVYKKLKELRDFLVGIGWGNKPIWLTETGWDHGQPSGNVIHNIYGLMEKMKVTPWWHKTFYFHWEDGRETNPKKKYGIIDANTGDPLSSYHSYRHVIKKQPARIKLISPADEATLRVCDSNPLIWHIDVLGHLQGWSIGIKEAKIQYYILDILNSNDQPDYRKNIFPPFDNVNTYHLRHWLPSNKLQVDQAYKWRVRAVDVHNRQGAWSPLRTFVLVRCVVPKKPIARFGLTVNKLTAKLTDQSSDPDGTIVSWEWSFGDGTSSTAQHPSHTYAQAGPYLIVLKVTDNSGLTDTESKNVTVTQSIDPPVPPNQCGKIKAGQGLTKGAQIKSCDGRYRLVLQPDGNLVLRGDGLGGMWSSKTHGKPAFGAYMQTNGNFSIKRTDGVQLWSSATSNNAGAWLAVQNDGNVVIYKNSQALWSTMTSNRPPKAAFTFSVNNRSVKFTDKSSDDRKLVSWHWHFGDNKTSSARHPTHNYSRNGTFNCTLTVKDSDGVSKSIAKSVKVQPGINPPVPPNQCGKIKSKQGLGRGQMVKSCDGRFKFILQTDGNLVLYKNTQALWSSRTNGKASFGTYMQADGNFVIYTQTGNPLWATGSRGNGAWLAVQNDGNVVIYRKGKALWATGTSGH